MLGDKIKVEFLSWAGLLYAVKLQQLNLKLEMSRMLSCKLWGESWDIRGSPRQTATPGWVSPSILLIENVGQLFGWDPRQEVKHSGRKEEMPKEPSLKP